MKDQLPKKSLLCLLSKFLAVNRVYLSSLVSLPRLSIIAKQAGLSENIWNLNISLQADCDILNGSLKVTARASAPPRPLVLTPLTSIVLSTCCSLSTSLELYSIKWTYAILKK